MDSRIGETLVRRGTVSKDQLQAAVRRQRSSGGRVGSILLQMGAVDEVALSETLAAQMRARCASPLQMNRLERTVPNVLARKLVLKYRAVPMRLVGRTLHLLVTDHRRLSGLSTATGYRIQPWIASDIRVRRLLERHYGIRLDAAYAEPPGEPDARPHADGPGDGDGFERLGKQLLTIEDPAQAVEAVLDHAARFMPVCVFFRVRQDSARILAARGLPLDGAARDRFVAPAWSGTPLELLTVRSHYRGRLPEADAYRSFFQELGLEVPVEILLLPIRLTDQVFGIMMGTGSPTQPLDHPGETDARLARMLVLALTLTVLKDKMRAAARPRIAASPA
jgi:hypothetical protein